MVWAVAFAPDGERLLTGTGFGAVHLWDAETGKPVLVLKGHQSRVSSVAFSPDRQCIATGCEDQTVKIWDVANVEQSASVGSERTTSLAEP
jgi:WD40 repeat protein